MFSVAINTYACDNVIVMTHYASMFLFILITCAAPPPPLLSNFTIMIIVAAVLGALSLLLLVSTIACAVRARRLKQVNVCIICHWFWTCSIMWFFYLALRKELLEATYVENEIAFARSQGAFTLSNPLAVVKDEGKQHIWILLLHAYHGIYRSIIYIIYYCHPYADLVTKKPLYLTPDEMSEFEEKQKI